MGVGDVITTAAVRTNTYIKISVGIVLGGRDKSFPGTISRNRIDIYENERITFSFGGGITRTGRCCKQIGVVP